ncbi:MAG: alpha/beta hydrolase [Gammaproteobacteria bacterium]|nr:alpha/beta hydrolase [Gammaproteobacteria bacterium]
MKRLLSTFFILGATATMADLYESVEHKYAIHGDVKIHYVAVGDESAPLVVMIHGFPDFWYTWRSQMEALQLDYRVVAVDLRGYNLSDKPEGVESYVMPLLVQDIQAVIASEERESAVVVGHDWGGAIAWNIAMMVPDAVDLLVILNLPHPAGLAREIANNPEQRESSAYAFRFQQPDAHLALTSQMLAGWVRDKDAREKYIEAFDKSNFESMLNYYKANYPRSDSTASQRLLPEETVKVKCPVLMFHGLDDTALLPGALNGTWNWLEKDLTLVTIPGADHFVQQDRPKMINEVLVDWLARQLARSSD